MQGKAPFLALLGLFVLIMTFFFCGEGVFVSPPPAGSVAILSGNWTCWLWAVVGAGLLGWGINGVVLGSTIDDKRREVERLMGRVTMLTNQPPEVRTVEKRVEVPVERVVLKRVEVPVEKVVDRPVDNPEHLARIKVLEGEVAVIVGLLRQIAQLQTASSQAGGRGNEGRVVVPVDNPEQLDRIKALEGEVAVIDDLRVQIAELQAASSQVGDKVVEKRIETSDEKHGKVPTDSSEHLARIKALEAEVASIDDLRMQIAELQAVSSQAWEKGVEKQIETPDAANGNVWSDSSEHLARIKALEAEVAAIAELRAQIAECQAASSRAREMSVEEPIDTRAEQTIVQSREVPVETVSVPAGDLESAGVDELSDEAPADTESPDDLKQIRGVGPALERFLHKRGVFCFRQVASWSQADIDKFEFLLPNFSGRIQRENWVHSAQIEHYKKYKQWLGNGEPPRESADLHAQAAELQAVSSQAGGKFVEKRIETPAEQHGDVTIEATSERSGDLDAAGAVELADDTPADQESPDDLKQIRGVGPALERFLHKRGVFWFGQVATWSQRDIDKFEFLLPNFSGRIQRENWVHSAQIEHYKKYKQWLGDGEPPSERPVIQTQGAGLQSASSQAEGVSAETLIDTPAEQAGMQNRDMPVEAISTSAGGLDAAGAVGPADDAPADTESTDDLKQIRGVGPALERFLHKRGIFWFGQVASWSQSDIDKFEFLLPNFSGRIQRENWVHSARVEYYKKYKKWLGDGEPPSSPPETPSV